MDATGVGHLFEPRAPEMIARFQLHERLGSGATGSVYRATDLRTQQVVALKVVHAYLQDDPYLLRLLEREARATWLIGSPAVVRVREVGVDRGRPFLAMEFVPGPHLPERIEQGSVAVDQALRLALQIARVLEAAHRRGIVHRDLKPANILLTPDGEVRVADFGIARVADATTLVSTSGGFIGTFTYAAPEQFNGRADIRSDIYALGVILFEMLTGKPPFAPASELEGMRLHQEMAPPLARLASLPRSVVTIVTRCLAKQPAQRYQQPAALVRALERALWRQSGHPLRLAWWPERLLPAALRVGLVVVLVTGSSTFWSRESLQAPATSSAATVATVAPAVSPSAPTSTPVTPVAALPDGRWRVLGDGAIAQGLFSRPRHIAVSERGLVYVADIGNDRIQKLSTAGQVLETRQYDEEDEFLYPSPSWMATDRQGNLYSTDSGRGLIRKASPEGAPLRLWSTESTSIGELKDPRGIAVDDQGNIYVADAGNHRVLKFSSTGQPLAQWGRQGLYPGELTNPTWLAVDRQGNVYVSEPTLHRVQKLSPTGQPLVEYSDTGGGTTGPSRLVSPQGIAVDGQGNLYVADAGNQRIQAFAPDGRPLRHWGAAGTAVGQLRGPAGLAIDGQSAIYVVDSGNDRVQVLELGSGSP